MVKRKIIKIDEAKCDGCGLCVTACHEGAIQIVDHKARLVSEVYCDGLGDCLGECPQDAITIEERDAEAFDEKAVEEHLARKAEAHAGASAGAESAPPLPPVGGGCPGAALRKLSPQPAAPAAARSAAGAADAPPAAPGLSGLGNWPVQLMLVPPAAPFLKDCDLLICADCVPFAVPDFHTRYLAGKILLVGCPKLDNLPHYEEKLKAIFTEAKPRSITVLKMEVPCCGGIAQVAVAARKVAAPDTPIKVHTVGIQGAEIACEDVAS